MGDCDIGEMFLNFMLDTAIIPYAGVDFKDIFKTNVETTGISSQEVIWEWIKTRVWERTMRGFSPSPYMVTKHSLEVEYLIYGDRYDRKYVCQWLRIVLNLPGMKRY